VAKQIQSINQAKTAQAEKAKQRGPKAKLGAKSLQVGVSFCWWAVASRDNFPGQEEPEGKLATSIDLLFRAKPSHILCRRKRPPFSIKVLLKLALNPTSALGDPQSRLPELKLHKKKTQQELRTR